jgi:hypothetical protein
MNFDLITYIITAYDCSIYHAVVAYQYAGQTDYNRTFAERIEHYFIKIYER